jgi:hypothetical protein
MLNLSRIEVLDDAVLQILRRLTLGERLSQPNEPGK